MYYLYIVISVYFKFIFCAFLILREAYKALLNSVYAYCAVRSCSSDQINKYVRRPTTRT